MKKIIVFLLIIASVISGCSFDAQVLTPAPVVQTLPPVTPIVPSPIATDPGTAVTYEDVFVPNTTEPVLYNAFVSRDEGGTFREAKFPAGIRQIHALWSYQNMQAGLTVKRDWYLNGELWLSREEPWDFSKYGATGIMQGVSIYDLDAGLPSGEYRLVVSIDGVLQPIGKRIIESTAETFLAFEILQPIEATSPNEEWQASSLVTRLVLTNANGDQSDVYTGSEIVSVVWLDNQHLLFVDRDRSGQVAEPLVGVRDELLVADIVSREVWSLYKSETALGQAGGLYPSPGGNYVAGIEGSGFGDACFLDAKVIFFEMLDGNKTVRVIQQDQFAGMPVLTDRTLYPAIVGTWKNNTQYEIPLNETCATNQASSFYLFDLPNRTATVQPSEQTPIPGDLGWGEIHGVVIDALTGQPIQDALVTCEHNSYTSGINQRCSGGIYTDANGNYVYQRIFFHDTDTIKLTVTAPGYQSQEIIQSAFTVAGMERNFSLTK